MQKKVYWTNFVQFWILYSDIFFLSKIPYFNYQINFQSSHLTKKETEDASKRRSSYCMGALNCKTKKIAISKISNKKFRKIHNFANIKYKRNSRKYCEKNRRRNIFVKRKIFAKKNWIKKIFTQKKLEEKDFRKKNL